MKPKRERHYWRWLVLAIIVTFAWGGWRAWDEKQAFKEAQALGWKWNVKEPFEVIRLDWKAAFRKETWLHRRRALEFQGTEEYDKRRDLVRRLHPRQRRIRNASEWHDLSALKGALGFATDSAH